MSEEPTNEVVEETEVVAPAAPEAPEAPTSNLAEAPPAPVAPVLRDPTQDEEPTYQVEPWSGLTRYVCLLDGHEDWSEPTFKMHMDAYHRGVMREAPAGPAPAAPEAGAVAAAGSPEGQTSDTPAEETPAPPVEAGC